MKKQTDIALLLMILVSLSASIGILHGRKKTIDPAITANEANQILEFQDAIDYIQPYLMSGNVDLVAATVSQFDNFLFERIVDAILNDETLKLLDEQKVQMLGALLLHDKNVDKHRIVFDRMVEKFAQYPLLVPLVPRYKNAIAIVKGLAEQSGNNDQFTTWINLSLDETINKDDVAILTGLIEADIPIDAKKASALLFQVAAENKKSAFIPILVHMKADINYSPDGKYTPLDQVLDPKVGSARQVAFERGYSAIELVLKNIAD
jgi:hypothetical protein